MEDSQTGYQIYTPSPSMKTRFENTDLYHPFCPFENQEIRAIGSKSNLPNQKMGDFQKFNNLPNQKMAICKNLTPSQTRKWVIFQNITSQSKKLGDLQEFNLPTLGKSGQMSFALFSRPFFGGLK